MISASLGHKPSLPSLSHRSFPKTDSPALPSSGRDPCSRSTPEGPARLSLCRAGWPVTLLLEVSAYTSAPPGVTSPIAIALLSRPLLSAPCFLHKYAHLLLGSLHQEGGCLSRAHHGLAEWVLVQGWACSALFPKACPLPRASGPKSKPPSNPANPAPITQPGPGEPGKGQCPRAAPSLSGRAFSGRQARGPGSRLTSNLATFHSAGLRSRPGPGKGWESGINQAPCWQLSSPPVLAAPRGGRTCGPRRSPWRL